MDEQGFAHIYRNCWKSVFGIIFHYTHDEEIAEEISHLHTGSVLGLGGKLLTFLAGLIAAGLPVTGFLIWLKRGK